MHDNDSKYRKDLRDSRVEIFQDPAELKARISTIKAWIFDWDGVFNTGMKSGDSGSTFSEGDSMGVNMLRFGTWLGLKQQMPVTAILTGEHNAAAAYFAKREHFDYCFRGFSDKRQAFDQILRERELHPSEVGFFFDDILDLSVARQCGLRLCARRFYDGSFERYLRKKGWVDIVSGMQGGHYAVRQLADAILDLAGNYETVVDRRIDYDATYRAYLSQRNAIDTVFVESDKLKERMNG